MSLLDFLKHGWSNMPIVDPQCLTDATTCAIAWRRKRPTDEVCIKYGHVPGQHESAFHAQAFAIYKGNLWPLRLTRNGNVEPGQMDKFEPDRTYTLRQWFRQLERWLKV